MTYPILMAFPTSKAFLNKYNCLLSGKCNQYRKCQPGTCCSKNGQVENSIQVENVIMDRWAWELVPWKVSGGLTKIWGITGSFPWWACKYEPPLQAATNRHRPIEGTSQSVEVLKYLTQYLYLGLASIMGETCWELNLQIRQSSNGLSICSASYFKYGE